MIGRATVRALGLAVSLWLSVPLPVLAWGVQNPGYGVDPMRPMCMAGAGTRVLYYGSANGLAQFWRYGGWKTYGHTQPYWYACGAMNRNGEFWMDFRMRGRMGDMLYWMPWSGDW